MSDQIQVNDFSIEHGFIRLVSDRLSADRFRVKTKSGRPLTFTAAKDTVEIRHPRVSILSRDYIEGYVEVKIFGEVSVVSGDIVLRKTLTSLVSTATNEQLAEVRKVFQR